MFPRRIPNLNHNLFNGVSNFELKIPNTKNIIDIEKAHTLISPEEFNNGHKETIKNTIKNTIPKLLFDPICIFIYFQQ